MVIFGNNFNRMGIYIAINVPSTLQRAWQGSQHKVFITVGVIRAEKTDFQAFGSSLSNVIFDIKM